MIKTLAKQAMEAGGFYALDKPVGITSQRALTIAKRQLGIKKAGHSGTLDPLASGLLVVAVGSWSRLLAFVLGADKVYYATVRCGLRTDTLDITGAVEGFQAVPSTLGAEAVQAGLASFLGTIDQLPPAFSALKVNGVRAYALARAGEEVTLAQRSVTIYAIDLLDLARSGPFLDVVIRVHCSSGTYIRSLARDLGELLGTGATLYALRRESIGSVTLASAKDPTSLEPDDRLPLSVIFPDAPSYAIERELLTQARNGHVLACPPALGDGKEVLVLAQGAEPEYQRLVGVYGVQGDKLVPLRVVPPEGAK
ncbi:tRNA pseudouridine(55) synthase TruB [Ferrimicrobium sp.]|uniref:tRNA pseudouridine(55) synthase TruB n=1 Tax=Ferrimicrobium sp. TaxID=2926050 RepID=UPI0027E586ED|nr:tRNA pseudouridine(55) synthase TruB [Ferrimicrobium sp.]